MLQDTICQKYDSDPSISYTIKTANFNKYSTPNVRSGDIIFSTIDDENKMQLSKTNLYDANIIQKIKPIDHDYSDKYRNIVTIPNNKYSNKINNDTIYSNECIDNRKIRKKNNDQNNLNLISSKQILDNIKLNNQQLKNHPNKKEEFPKSNFDTSAIISKYTMNKRTETNNLISLNQKFDKTCITLNEIHNMRKRYNEICKCENKITNNLINKLSKQIDNLNLSSIKLKKVNVNDLITYIKPDNENIPDISGVYKFKYKLTNKIKEMANDYINNTFKNKPSKDIQKLKFYKLNFDKSKYNPQLSNIIYKCPKVLMTNTMFQSIIKRKLDLLKYNIYTNIQTDPITSSNAPMLYRFFNNMITNKMIPLNIIPTSANIPIIYRLFNNIITNKPLPSNISPAIISSINKSFKMIKTYKYYYTIENNSNRDFSLNINDKIYKKRSEYKDYFINSKDCQFTFNIDNKIYKYRPEYKEYFNKSIDNKILSLSMTGKLYKRDSNYYKYEENRDKISEILQKYQVLKKIEVLNIKFDKPVNNSNIDKYIKNTKLKPEVKYENVYPIEISKQNSINEKIIEHIFSPYHLVDELPKMQYVF